MRLALVVALAACAVAPMTASADTRWTRLSADSNSNITEPGLVNSGADVVAAWSQATPNVTSRDVQALTFTTSAAKDMTDVRGPVTALSQWAFIGSKVDLLPRPTGLALLAAGIHSTLTSDPLIGSIIVPRNADGSFGTPLPAGSSSSATPDGIALADGTPLWASDESLGLRVRRGIVPGQNGIDLQAAVGGCCAYHPAVAQDATGAVWVAWYSNATGATGIYLQRVDPATGGPVGAPVKAPSSEPVNDNSFRIALVCPPVGAGCRVVYGTVASDFSSGRVVSWAPGESAPTTIARVQSDAGRVVAAAYRGDGKLWVAWFNRGTTATRGYEATLGDARGAGGTVLDAGHPPVTAPAVGEGYSLTALARGDDLLLAANWAPTTENRLALWVNLVEAPAAVAAPPGPRDVTVERAPKGAGFRIQVQYRVRMRCSNPCRATAELRTRAGRRLYAGPLPGDGKVVLGRRAGLKLPTTRKVRFYVTVSKAQLLRAPFHTAAGFRIAETRLRVTLQTPAGPLVTVRDGRIKVSIARIRSGALPGLRGIL